VVSDDGPKPGGTGRREPAAPEHRRDRPVLPHRWDRAVRSKDRVGARPTSCAGKVRAIGLRKFRRATLVRAHAVHDRRAAVRVSLWTRNSEIDWLQTCRQSAAEFSLCPLGPGFFRWASCATRTRWASGEFRRRCLASSSKGTRPNLQRLDQYAAMEEAGARPANWRSPGCWPRPMWCIPGTRGFGHLEGQRGCGDVHEGRPGDRLDADQPGQRARCPLWANTRRKSYRGIVSQRPDGKRAWTPAWQSHRLRAVGPDARAAC